MVQDEMPRIYHLDIIKRTITGIMSDDGDLDMEAQYPTGSNIVKVFNLKHFKDFVRAKAKKNYGLANLLDYELLGYL